MRLQVRTDFHTFWPISESSFRVLMATRYHRRGSDAISPGSTANGDWSDERFLPKPCREVARAITIAASPGDTWSCLSQMMRGGGMYGWPRLESAAISSADTVLGVSEPRVGDRVGGVAELIVVVPGQELVWRLPDTTHVLGFPVGAITLDYRLSTVSALQTVLAVRMRGATSPVTNQLYDHLFDVVDYCLPAHQLGRIRSLAESSPEQTDDRGFRSVRAHQVIEMIPAGVESARSSTL